MPEESKILEVTQCIQLNGPLVSDAWTKYDLHNCFLRCSDLKGLILCEMPW